MSAWTVVALIGASYSAVLAVGLALMMAASRAERRLEDDLARQMRLALKAQRERLAH